MGRGAQAVDRASRRGREEIRRRVAEREGVGGRMARDH
jgi:hypothetical protein